MAYAVVTVHGKIRIISHRDSQFLEGVCMAAAARAVHRGKYLVFIGQLESASSCRRPRCGRLLRGRLSQELTMCGVAKVDVAMAAPAGCQIRPCRHCLRF